MGWHGARAGLRAAPRKAQAQGKWEGRDGSWNGLGASKLCCGISVMALEPGDAEH